MFLLTGTVNDKDYNGEVLTGSQMEKIFNLKAKGIIYFEHHTSKVRFSNTQKESVSAIGRLYPSVFQGSYKGNTLEIRFYEGKTGTGEKTVYSPKDVTILNYKTRDAVNADVRKDFCIYLMLHPRNADSPIMPLKRQKDMSFQIYDERREGKEALKAQTKVMDLQGKLRDLFEKDPNRLIAIAYSVKLKGVKVTANSTADEVFAQLYSAANREPDALAQYINDNKNYVAGVFRLALVNGTLKQSKTANGSIEFAFNDGSVLIRAPKDADAADFAINYLNENFDRYSVKFLGEGKRKYNKKNEPSDTPNQLQQPDGEQ